jgi:lysozyme
VIPVSQKLIDAVKQFEGLARVGKDGLVHPYKCPAGFWTIGYGQLCKANQRALTKQECEALLLEQLPKYQAQALRLSPVLYLAPPGWTDAITDFVFNLGAARYAGSTLRKRIDSEDAFRAKTELVKWVFGGGKRLPGLITRRLWEASQF